MLVIGLPGSGKSCFLEQAKRNFTRGHRAIPLPSIQRTIGVNIAKLHTVGVDVNVWDVGGTVREQLV